MSAMMQSFVYLPSREPTMRLVRASVAINSHSQRLSLDIEGAKNLDP